MVKVREQQPIQHDGLVDIPRWLDQLFEKKSQGGGSLQASDRAELQKACELAYRLDQQATAVSKDFSKSSANRWDNTSSFSTGLEMAQILADLQLDIHALVAAILYRSVREEKIELKKIHEQFGSSVAELIHGVLQMAAIGSLRGINDNQALGQSSSAQIDNLRKMLITIIGDVRVALLKLAERTCAIRAVKNCEEEKQRRVAKEVFDIYAPLAHRLGIGYIKWELEDLAFRYLQAETYHHIAKLLAERWVDRQSFVDGVVVDLQAELAKQGIQSEIHGRTKHIYSIWQKMQEKNITFSQVYDVRAVRILVDTVHECYMALGVVHGLWRTVPNEFDDYIARPKENGYRSLHTAVIGPEDKVMEVQIRTHWMHSEAEFGVCAHWQYKTEDEESSPTQEANKKGLSGYEEKLEWLRQVLDWHEETGGDSALIEELRSDIIHDKIYIFTPEGHVIELPKGATPLDFAYHVHTEVGHRCRGARVNGKIMPLNKPLKTSDQVEIITGKNEAPNREWLSEGLGYIHTARARSKVHQWFKQLAREQSLADGSVMLDREFRRLALNNIDLEQLAQNLRQKNVEDLYAAVGSSVLEIVDVLRAAQKLDDVLGESGQLSFSHLHEEEPAPIRHISGVGGLTIEYARCCSPMMNDAIGGVVDQQTKAIIHRQDCTQFLQIQEDFSEKIIKVDWESEQQATYQVNLDIDAYERLGLLKDITELFDQERVNILEFTCKVDKLTNTVSMSFSVEVTSLNTLSILLLKLNQLPNIYLATRRR